MTINFSTFLAKLEEAKKCMKEEEDEVEDEKRNDERADKKADRRGRKYPVKMHDGDDDGKNLGEEADNMMESKEHYMGGYNAHKQGKTRQHNPFKEGSMAAKHWANGWTDASDKKEPAKFTEEVDLDEGQTIKTKTGVIHKGSYGSEYETDEEGNEKKKEAPAVKRGRGRPKKGSDESGNVKKYTFHDLLNKLSR